VKQKRLESALFACVRQSLAARAGADEALHAHAHDLFELVRAVDVRAGYAAYAYGNDVTPHNLADDAARAGGVARLLEHAAQSGEGLRSAATPPRASSPGELPRILWPESVHFATDRTGTRRKMTK
jgi:hypothetical protein